MAKLVLLHVSDWNSQNKYYTLPLDLLRKFSTKAQTNPCDAWQWLIAQTGYGSNPEKPVQRCDVVDLSLDEYFYDYMYPADSISDWNEEWQDTDNLQFTE
jgi:hypothetical protein